MLNRILKIALIVIFSLFITGCKKVDQNLNEEVTVTNETVAVKIAISNQELTASLNQNETTAALLDHLPLKITMNELNGNEKYYYFDTSLPNDSQAVNQINAGDIMLYGDNCLVIFYQSFDTSYQYTRIGQIDDVTRLKQIINGSDDDIEVSIYIME